MIKPTSKARQHRIVSWAECGRLLAGLVASVQVVTSHSGVGERRPEFWGLMEQLQDLAVHVVSLQDLDHDNGRATALGVGE